MKEEINLLPPTVIKSRIHWIYSKRLVRLAGICIMSLIIINASLIAGNFVVRENLNSLSVDDVLKDEEGNGSIEEKIKDINELLNIFKAKTQEYRPWLPLVKDIVAMTPANTTLNSFALEEKNGQQSLTIRAQTSQRSEVVAWQRELEALSWVEKVEAPLQNFATGPDTAFSFTLYREE